MKPNRDHANSAVCRSLLARSSGAVPVGSETEVVSQTDLQQAGITQPSDLTRLLPQLVTSDLRENHTVRAAQQINPTRGEGFDLRGLGANGTLLLINGHRTVPNGALISFADASQVPLVALDRVEVVTDGASAVYGADAVGGGVNYILRKNYDGVEVDGRYTTQRGNSAYNFSLVAGKTGPRIVGRLPQVMGHGDWTVQASGRQLVA